MSELRQDLVSGDWIIMAPERAGRPHGIGGKKSKRKPSPKNSCPFEDLQKSGNWPPLLSYPSDKNWRIVLVPNKFPALTHKNSVCAMDYHEGPYPVKSGTGVHDILITRDHHKNFADLTLDEATKVLQLLQKRYQMLSRDKCLFYTSAFFNWGAAAGASLYHPHYQVITLPILPSDFKHSLLGLESYHKKHHLCAHCVMLKEELKQKKRIVAQNSGALLVAPFVSRVAYEIRVFPKKHLSHFEHTPLKDLRDMAAMLQTGIKRIRNRLGDPDFNFFIHSAPLKRRHKYNYYHWHIEIIPKISIFGGFELSTGVDINVVEPELAAAVLRGTNNAS
jgi:UDPglucose--hexose-1-phosphate uridylyltransferase